MKAKVLLVCFFAVLASLPGAYAQKEESPKLAAQKDYLFHKQFTGGMRIVTTGLDFYLQYGIIKNIYTTHLFTLEYEWHIDYRDKKSTAQPDVNGNTGRNYYFGVQNRFHVIRFSYGFERCLADKAVKNGVRLSWVGFVGGSLGLVKPYYLDLFYPGTDGQQVDVLSQRYTPANASHFLQQDSIYQASPIWRGMGLMSPVVGGFGRTGLNFDFGSKDRWVTALEAGVSLEVFYKKIPIYVTDDSNHALFLGFYLSFAFGKRW